MTRRVEISAVLAVRAGHSAQAQADRWADGIPLAAGVHNVVSVDAELAGVAAEGRHDGVLLGVEIEPFRIRFAEIVAKPEATAEWFALEAHHATVTAALRHHASQLTVDGDDIVHSGGQRDTIRTAIGLRRR